MLSVNFNPGSQSALNGLIKNNSVFSKTMEKLSTGYRVNRASDDAAGLAISERLRSQIRGSQQAVRNVLDAINVFKIEDGVLDQVHGILQRLRELAVQSANGIYSDRQRTYLHQEEMQLIEEINRLAGNKNFNGAFQMDGTHIQGEVTAGLNQALSGGGFFSVQDINKIKDFVNDEIEVTILQDATAQQLIDASQRSLHVLETRTGVTSAVLPSSGTLAGSSSGLSGDTIINLTTLADSPLDGAGTLRRSHDNGIVSSYSILGAPIPAGTAFQIDVTNPAQARYNVFSQAGVNSFPSGNLVFSTTDVFSLNLVRAYEPVISFTETYLGDADGIADLSNLGVTSIQQVERFNGVAWVPLAERMSGLVGDYVYEWNGAQQVTVGIKQPDTTVLPSPPTDIRVTYFAPNNNTYMVIPDLASGVDGQTVYQWDGNRTMQVGLKSGAVIVPNAAYVVLTSYTAWEDSYTFSYNSYNKYQLSGGTLSGGVVELADDLYAGSDVPADNNGYQGLEVRINGALTGNYTYYKSGYMGLNNVVVFDSTPTLGDSLTFNYATTNTAAVDWSAATLGESTMNNGSISNLEAQINDGTWNDFWVGQGTNTITITQPNRSKIMTLAIDPNWTKDDLVNNLNSASVAADVELIAYVEGGTGEVRIRPGSLTKERPVTGWEGAYFELRGAVIPFGGTVPDTLSNIGSGASGDDPNNQNFYAARETVVAGDSQIQVRLISNGSIIETSTSNWNEHLIEDLGIYINALSTGSAGMVSRFKVSAGAVQASANVDADNNFLFFVPNVTSQALGLDAYGIATQSFSTDSIGIVDDAIERISSYRTNFGTLINRGELAVSHLQNLTVNMAQSESSIRDADMAEEMSTAIKHLILERSGMAMLSQANLVSKNILHLLSR